MSLQLSARAVVTASTAAAWDVLSHVTAWPAWTPTVSQVEALDGDRLALGQRFRVVQPKLTPLVWEVTRVEPPLAFGWQARSRGVILTADHRLLPGEDGRCTLLLDFGFDGALGACIGRIWRWRAQQYLDTEARAFQARMARESS